MTFQLISVYYFVNKDKYLKKRKGPMNGPGLEIEYLNEVRIL